MARMNPNLFRIFYFKLLLWHTKISEFKLLNLYLYIYFEQYCGQELVHALNCNNYPDASGKLRLMHMLHKLSRSHLWQIFPRRFYPWMFSFFWHKSLNVSFFWHECLFCPESFVRYSVLPLLSCFHGDGFIRPKLVCRHISLPKVHQCIFNIICILYVQVDMYIFKVKS